MNLREFLLRPLKTLDTLLGIRRRLQITVMPYGHRSYDPAKEDVMPHGHRSYDPTKHFVVPSGQRIYDPSVFGTYDLAAQRVVSKDHGSKPELSNFDILMREAQRYMTVAPVKLPADRYAQVLSLLESLGPGTGICLDACTSQPLDHARQRISALGYEYMPIDYCGDGNTVKKEDVTKLSFPDCSVARIISLDTLEHIENYAAAVVEFYRVLCDDGIAVIHVPCYYFEQPKSVSINPAIDPWGHVRYFSAREVIATLAEAGFIILRVSLQFDYGAVLCIAAKNRSITGHAKGR
jgi:SAM-dependent methyltransferase